MDAIRVAHLSIGSNLGDRVAHLHRALAEMRMAGIDIARGSSIYETEPVGYQNQPWFLNMAVAVRTCLPPRALLSCCLEIETRQGRERPFQGAPRTLDLDILLVGDLVLDEPDLMIPHPRMTQRRFVLIPLADIAPEVIHPVLGKTISSLLASCPDESRVSLYSQLS